MTEEIMPHVVPAVTQKRTLWIDNLKPNRHTDVLLWVADPDDGGDMVRLSEAQTRHLLATLTAYVAQWDAAQ